MLVGIRCNWTITLASTMLFTHKITPQNTHISLQIANNIYSFSRALSPVFRIISITHFVVARCPRTVLCCTLWTDSFVLLIRRWMHKRFTRCYVYLFVSDIAGTYDTWRWVFSLTSSVCWRFSPSNWSHIIGACAIWMANHMAIKMYSAVNIGRIGSLWLYRVSYRFGK